MAEARVDDEFMICEVEPVEAEAVLTLWLFIPGVVEGGEDQFYLARIPSRQLAPVVESVTTNPDGSVTKRLASSVVERSTAHGCHTDGRTADGRGFGSSKYVSLTVQSAEVGVRLNVSWTDAAGGHGILAEELVVPWLGSSRQEWGDGKWVAARIERIRSIAEPHAAPGGDGVD